MQLENMLLVRKQSYLRKLSNKDKSLKGARKARQFCHKQFWRFSKELLDNNEAGKTTPTFSREETYYFFCSTYKSVPESFQKPGWMPLPKSPREAFDLDPIQTWEIMAPIKHSRSKSAPSPFDQIPYAVFKNCPSLIHPLLDLYNCCWSTSTVP